MRRREFIALVGRTALAWPFAARAQQEEPLRRVAILEAIAKDTPGAQERYTAFLKAFEQLGWTRGRNLQIEARWGEATEPQYKSMRRNSLRLPRTYLSPVAAPLRT